MKVLLQLGLSCKRCRALLALSLGAMCLLTVASQLEIFTLGVLTQKGSEHKSGDFIASVMQQIDGYFDVMQNPLNLALMIFAVAIFKAITLFIHRYGTRLLAIKISSALRLRYFEHIQSLPMHFYQQHNIGSLSSRVVADAASVAEAINATVVNYLQTPFVIATTLILCFLTSWQLSLIVFFGCPIIIFPIFFLAGRVKKISRQLLKNQECFAQVLVDFIAGIHTVKVFAMEDFSLQKYRQQNDALARLEKKSARYDLSTRPVVHTIGMAFLAGALLYGLYGLEMAVADVLFYCGLLYVFYEPIKKFAEENSHIQRGVAAAERMIEVLQLHASISDDSAAVSIRSFDNSIIFDEVWFRYDDHRWILRNVSFAVEKGQTVAIVGPTGAGKSTIVSLLPRLWEIERGQILIDGKSLNTFTQKSLRDLIAVVPQRPFLFLDTIAENISFGRSYTLDKLQQAASQAHADEFIGRMHAGYDTVLAEAGKNLSGGQQQRLAIARALFKDAPILVMDEATSSLDNVSEGHIKAAIRELKGSRTVIIIAHRLSTIEDADKIVYMEEGSVVAQGSKEELLVSCEGFRKMWRQK